MDLEVHIISIFHFHVIVVKQLLVDTIMLEIFLQAYISWFCSSLRVVF